MKHIEEKVWEGRWEYRGYVIKKRTLIKGVDSSKGYAFRLSDSVGGTRWDTAKSKAAAKRMIDAQLDGGKQ